jgi:hypothetical protein
MATEKDAVVPAAVTEVPGSKRDQEYETARAALDRVFKLLGVKRVVIVDDELNATAEIGDFIARYLKLRRDNAARVKQMAALASVTHDATEEADVREDLQKVWDQLDDDKRDELMMNMDWISPKRTFSALDELLRGYHAEFLSLAKWKEVQAAATEAAALAESLLLFDLDMSKDQGTQDEGMRIIKSLLTTVKTQCQCGLLSHLVGKHDEYQVWQQYVQDYELQEQQGRFVVISKKHLPDAPIVFAQRLKRAAISSPCDSLRREVAQVLDEAFSDAKGHLSKLNVYDFEEIVFHSSHMEGVWEPDTLLRILALHTQRAARKLLKTKPEVEEHASRVRSVIDIGARPADAPAPSSQEIMRLELYEDADFLSTHHIPLDLGDLFQVDSTGTEYILLAQPCDIMCRNVGEDDRPNHVFLAPLVERATKDKQLDNAPAFWKLDAYSSDSAKTKYVNFHGARPVPILALDLTVLHAEGKAAFKTGQECPNNLIPAWQRRFEGIAAEVNRLFERYEGIRAAQPQGQLVDTEQIIAGALIGVVPDVLKGQLDIANRALIYDLRRIKRLKVPRAAALLRSFSAYMARDGFDHDLRVRIQSSSKKA